MSTGIARKRTRQRFAAGAKAPCRQFFHLGRPLEIAIDMAIDHVAKHVNAP